MYFINNIDLVFTLRWSEFCVVDDLSDIVHSGIARSIYLDDINHFTVVVGETVFAGVTGISISGNIGTVDAFCKDTSQCRLPNSMKSEKDIPMMKSPCFARICKNLFYKILADNIGEIFRAIGLVEGHNREYRKKSRKVTHFSRTFLKMYILACIYGF